MALMKMISAGIKDLEPAVELPINSGKIQLSSSTAATTYSGTAPVPTQDPEFRQGWYYAKSSGAQQFIYTFDPEGTHAITIANLDNVFFVGAVDTYTDLDSVPYIAVETKPLGDGSDASPGNYRSRYTYKISATTSAKKLLLSELTQFSTTEKPKPSFPYQTIHLNNVSSVGPVAADEEIKNIKIEIATTSAATAKVLVSNVGWKEKNRTDVNPCILLSGFDDNEEIAKIETRLTAGYEDQTMAGTSGLLVYGGNNGTSIDMLGYRNLVMTISATATTGLSPLNNLMLYVSLDDTNFVTHHGFAQLYEKPLATGTYENTIKFENVGFRYIRLFAHALQGSPTAYVVKYSRSN
jgi:hypothetical protein